MNLPDAFEPPLSPAPFGAVDAGLRRPDEPAAPAAPVFAAPVFSAPVFSEQVFEEPAPLPNRLLRMGLVTLPQLTSALQRQAETGSQLPDVLLELGLVSAEDLAVLLADEQGSAPVDAIQVAPPPEAVLEPVFEPTLELAPAEPAPLEAPVFVEPVASLEADPEPAPPARFAVVAQLEGGSRIELGVYADLPSASHVATEAMRAVRDALSDWPLLGGRYVRPSAVVSVEVTALL